jgi:hypothetical protein
VLIVVSYALFAVFVVVFLFRTFGMAKLPVHLRWELSPVPHEKGRSRGEGNQDSVVHVKAPQLPFFRKNPLYLKEEFTI